MTESAQTFASLDRYLAVPRVSGLVLSPDGSRLVATVQALSADAKRYDTSLWEVDLAGGAPRRLTTSAAGESAPAFLPGGDLLFVSKRPDPAEPAAGAEAAAGLWLLPAGGGESRLVVGRPGGVGRPLAAREGSAVVVSGPTLAGAAEQDAEVRTARREADVSAVLHEGLPVRHWDRDLGPANDRLYALDGDRLRDLTPGAGAALVDADAAIAPDGATVYTDWRVTHVGGRESSRVVAIDVAGGGVTVVAAEDGEAEGQHDFSAPAVSPDGARLVVVDTRTETVESAPSVTLTVVDLGTGARSDLLPGFAFWPAGPVWTRGGDAVIFHADEAGHSPAWRVDVSTGVVTRLTSSGAYSDLCPSPDGRWVYALRAAVDSPARVVRLDASAPDQDPVVLDAPGEVGGLPGRLEEVGTTASDGARLRAWLVLPEGASADQPAPLLLWVHGGPLMSWNSWSWRWNPWLMAARGWAVLLPDPALSQGYGDDFVQRAWGQWGPVPYADLMAVTDAALSRQDLDGSRTAAMGGSYGGYMANWIAGHTDRFDAIVTHASLWTLDRFVTTTDHPGYWAAEWGWPDDSHDRYRHNSPHLHTRNITTPMLVVHGDRDYRVPVGEGMSLWTDLVRHGVDARFLYFPDEGHWVLRPGNVRVWYETVWAFLDHHVLGEEWRRPALL